MSFQRIVNTTLINFFKQQIPNIMRNRRLTALIYENGRVEYNMSGRQIEQRIQYRESDMTGYAEMDVVDFARQDYWKICNLPMRGYSAADAVTKAERLQNKGEQAIIKLFGQAGEILLKSCKERFGREFYNDGNATGYTKKMHGIESFMGQGGSVTVADGYKSPDDSFLGLDTDLGSAGGSWTGTWPNGTGDAEYDFWSPILIDYTDASAWSDGATWATNCEQVVAQGILDCQRNGTKEGTLDLIMVDKTMYAAYLKKQRASQRITVDRGEKTKLVSLGFKDVINQDGVDITWEFDIPANTGYGFNLNQMNVYSWQDEIFKADGPDFDPNTKSYRIWVDAFLNTFWNPRYFLKLYAYT